LGPQRTLVLVDGRRLGNGDPNTANDIQSNTFLAYDQLGRELFAAFTAKF
jgi:hypothetical protein